MEKEVSSTVSDMFSLVGTVFLWLYWPSFVGGEITPGTVESETTLTNTVLALIGSTVATFAVSAFLSGKMIRPVDIQNATLAGGVTIGATANLNLTPFGAVLIGCLAGMVSTFGFSFVQPFLHTHLSLHDTCGVHNLHGMPSILGGLVSAVLPLLITRGDAGPGILGKPVNQLIGIAVTIVAAVVSGAFTGIVLRCLKDNGDAMDDSMYWKVADDFGKTA